MKRERQKKRNPQDLEVHHTAFHHLLQDSDVSSEVIKLHNLAHFIYIKHRNILSELIQ